MTAPRTPVREGLFHEDGLVGGECGSCHRRHFPLGRSCPWCGEAEPSEVRLSRDGHLWSWTAVVTAPPGYEGPVPFGFGVVELPADGLRIVTRLTEPDPGALELGQPVRFTVVRLSDDTVTWAYAPAEPEGPA
jgi:uncharacterized OB-fold protein